MIIGFTGTRHGMKWSQKGVVEDLLRQFYMSGDVTCFHHGDCIGADEEAHDFAEECGFLIESHPCNIPKMRAYCAAAQEFPEKPPLDRNRDIVDACDVLIAAPADLTEQPKGGTWYTVRYARKLGRRIWIVWPSGKVKEEAARPPEVKRP